MYTPIKNSIGVWSRTALYRLGQVRQQLGFVEPLTGDDRREVQLQLPTSALPLFDTMSNADQQHSLRVCRGLQAQGCVEQDMLAAALLHDVGKAQGRVPFWTRPVIVLGKLCAPRLLAQVVLPLTKIRQIVDMQGRPLPSSFPECGFGDAPPIDGRASNRWSYGRGVPLRAPLHPRYYVWQRALSHAWWHADIGADLAAQAGLSEQTVLYIRTHHDPHGPAAALHRVDEVS